MKNIDYAFLKRAKEQLRETVLNGYVIPGNGNNLKVLKF